MVVDPSVVADAVVVVVGSGVVVVVSAEVVVEASASTAEVEVVAWLVLLDPAAWTAPALR